MDYSAIFAPAIHILIWLLPALLLLALLKSPWAKGHIGELWVRLFAHCKLDKTVYRRLHNVTLNTADGTTQIDHVFISPFGIFVLETKNMRGWIFGSEKTAAVDTENLPTDIPVSEPVTAELQTPQGAGGNACGRHEQPALRHQLCGRKHVQNAYAH